MAEGQQKKEVSKQPALSSRLMQMKFMQRGKEKTVLKEAAAEQVFSSLVAPRAYLSYVNACTYDTIRPCRITAHLLCCAVLCCAALCNGYSST